MLTKFTAKKIKYFLNKKLQFSYSWAFINDVQATGEALVLKREHPALQNMKFLNFFYFFVIFALLDPDPDSESRSIGLIESVSNPNLDPKQYILYRHV